MTLVDLFDFYVDLGGNLDRWMRGSITPVVNPPSAPTNVTASLVGTQVTVAWGLPITDGGAAITQWFVTCTTATSQTIAVANPRTTTFTVAAGGSYQVTVAADNSQGRGPAAAATATGRRYPGDPPAGKILVGASEIDENGMLVGANTEWFAPEADTGVKYSIQKHFCQGGAILSNFTPSTGEMAVVAKRERARGHIVLMNIAIQQSTDVRASTWRAAANLTANGNFMHGVYYNFISWCESGADAPDCPIWACMPHEPQGPGPLLDASGVGHKWSLDASLGMLPGDYADLQVAFRSCMDDYADANGVGGTRAARIAAYRWKRLSFGGLHTGEAFASGQAGKAVAGYYTSHLTGLAIDLRVHDWIGGDPYQNSISGREPPGRTGTPGWSSNMQAMATWCKARNKPIVFGEYGVHNSDGDAGVQLQAWWNEVRSGKWDIPAVIYFHSAPNAPPLNVDTGIGRWLFTDLIDNRPASGPNGGVSGGVTNPGMYATWKKIMKDPNVVHFWDLGYSRPPGV